MSLNDTLSPSQLKVWLTCEQQWVFAYIDKLSPKGSNPIFFEKGSYVHEILHLYYSLVKAGFPVGSDVVQKTIGDRIKEDIDEEMARAREEGRAPDLAFYRDVAKTITQYIKFVSPKIDNKIIFVEHEYHIEVPHQDVNVHGYIDLIYYDSIRRKWVIRDHKTGTSNTWSNKKVEEDIQLLMYGTLWYILTGEVAIVQINFLNTSQASKPKATTVLYETFEAHHNEQTYIAFWSYIQTILGRMSNSQYVQNFSSCGNCRYRRICRADLRGYSADRIIEANFNGPTAKPVEEIPQEGAQGSETSPKPFYVTLGR